MYYSKSRDGFYSAALHGDNIPSDAVEISDALYQELLTGQGEGKLIQSDASGNPVLAPPPAPTTAQIWGFIKARRDALKSAGVLVEAKWFHSDDSSRIQQLGLVMMGSAIPVGLQWKTMDGSFVTMTQVLAQKIFQATATNDQTIFAVAETHKTAMETSPNPATYDYTTGWPASFVSG